MLRAARSVSLVKHDFSPRQRDTGAPWR